jgi:hypothetical protein
MGSTMITDELRNFLILSEKTNLELFEEALKLHDISKTEYKALKEYKWTKDQFFTEAHEALRPIFTELEKTLEKEIKKLCTKSGICNFLDPQIDLFGCYLDMVSEEISLILDEQDE